MTIGVSMLVGSSRAGSLNERLAKAIERLAPKELVFERVKIDDLPFCDADLEKSPPEQVLRLKATLDRNPAAFFVMPEFNRSLPAVLKNAIDIGSRPMAANSWRGKVVAMTGASPGAIGTAVGQQHLRQILSVIGANVMAGEAYISFSQPDLIADDGHIENESTRAFIQAYVDRFAEFAQRLCDQ
ncbi:NADPH-dependent FMN reductase [Thalassovita taeanensis]|uniref:NAD(P)H-dependent FMN reductase n=1 Tax=Thalassovita taeanensis TaxID=657014 RepID=A0A1H9HCR4_9RHOB|nr:NADPH-dependent FMN reductase [Thalassovita taeanensis]SEQ60026.1 NAD(P)H-dependent FMN reductase [Thalassovita taeanensis]